MRGNEEYKFCYEGHEPTRSMISVVLIQILIYSQRGGLYSRVIPLSYSYRKQSCIVYPNIFCMLNKRPPHETPFS